MTNSLVIEVFARVLFSFTRGVTEHYDPDEPEVETFGCNDSLSSGGSRVELLVRWYCIYNSSAGVTEHYDPDEPEVEIFGSNDSLSSEGREWN
ncbi:hypothetical protein pdam_00012690 [Pocillopora damicornis]|uniref:Uncharacterized protein n=1 Tax=Pocillopora damicornis TaxID=46731 RepID=A0A3M6UMS6_POCDA|nr:hypothetical protein pdam_00012690 [Pocillopora damicornis]